MYKKYDSHGKYDNWQQKRQCKCWIQQFHEQFHSIGMCVGHIFISPEKNTKSVVKLVTINKRIWGSVMKSATMMCLFHNDMLSHNACFEQQNRNECFHKRTSVFSRCRSTCISLDNERKRESIKALHLWDTYSCQVKRTQGVWSNSQFHICIRWRQDCAICFTTTNGLLPFDGSLMQFSIEIVSNKGKLITEMTKR